MVQGRFHAKLEVSVANTYISYLNIIVAEEDLQPALLSFLRVFFYQIVFMLGIHQSEIYLDTVRR